MNGDHLFCGATSSEIAYLHGVTSNIQTQCDNMIKQISTTAVLGDVTLSGYKFCGASLTELGYLKGVTSTIQTQLNTCAKFSGSLE